MKRVLITVALFACTNTNDRASVDAQAVSGEMKSCGFSSGRVVTDSGVGALRVGRRMTDVRAECSVLSESSELGAEGLPEAVARVGFGGDTAIVTIDSGIVWSVALTKAAWKTSDSLGVGAALDQFVSRGARGLAGDAGLFLVVPAHCGISFRLPPSPAIRVEKASWSTAELRALPAEMRIDQVLIRGCTAK